MQRPNYAFLSDQNQRDKNEDSFLIFDVQPFGASSPLTVLTVADGMGGHEHGDYVSHESLRRISLSLFEQLTVAPALNRFDSEEAFSLESLSKALLDALEQANAHVKRMIASNGWQKAGSTLVAAAVYENSAMIVNLGDSPLFHYSRANNNITQVTVDHTVAGALMRGGLISPDMARIHEGGDRLEFFLGNETMPRMPPLYQVTLGPEDLLLLCSDGISGALSIEEIWEVLNRSYTVDPVGCDLHDVAEQFLEASSVKGETDNQTLILWRYEPRT
jgi:protein phosphatase